MSDTEMTISEILRDPMIRLMMRADGVSLKAMKALLIGAALAQRIQLASGERRNLRDSNSDQKQFVRSLRVINVHAQTHI
ncbi:MULTISPECIES: hypothetical protein [Rhizobium]|uniref:hypothetical protein n=1 Tax=Rhizobium TaxID=379 RepID=UPI001C900206|nr:MULTISPECIES: hypothetical protein [Rhizobium]MBY3136699.1 hypothetical protein [Rhizobium laguerreae]MBY5775419.1 hypothetical protein [Rhizobium leguminosarum]